MSWCCLDLLTDFSHQYCLECASCGPWILHSRGSVVLDLHLSWVTWGVAYKETTWTSGVLLLSQIGTDVRIFLLPNDDSNLLNKMKATSILRSSSILCNFTTKIYLQKKIKNCACYGVRFPEFFNSLLSLFSLLFFQLLTLSSWPDFFFKLTRPKLHSP